MAYFAKHESKYKLKAEDYRALAEITREKKLRNGISGYSAVQLRNFYVHGHTCSDAVKSAINAYILTKKSAL